MLPPTTDAVQLCLQESCLPSHCLSVCSTLSLYCSTLSSERKEQKAKWVIRLPSVSSRPLQSEESWTSYLTAAEVAKFAESCFKVKHH